MFDDFGESNIIVFTITTIFVQALNGANFLVFPEESSQLGEIHDEEPGKHRDGTCNRTFNDENESPSGVFAGVNA